MERGKNKVTEQGGGLSTSEGREKGQPSLREIQKRVKSQEPEKLEEDQGRGVSWGARRQTETSLEQPKPAQQQLAGPVQCRAGAQGQKAVPESTQGPHSNGTQYSQGL